MADEFTIERGYRTTANSNAITPQNDRDETAARGRAVLLARSELLLARF